MIIETWEYKKQPLVIAKFAARGQQMNLVIYTAKKQKLINFERIINYIP